MRCQMRWVTTASLASSRPRTRRYIRATLHTVKHIGWAAHRQKNGCLIIMKLIKQRAEQGRAPKETTKRAEATNRDLMHSSITFPSSPPPFLGSVASDTVQCGSLYVSLGCLESWARLPHTSWPGLGKLGLLVAIALSAYGNPATAQLSNCPTAPDPAPACPPRVSSSSSSSGGVSVSKAEIKGEISMDKKRIVIASNRNNLNFSFGEKNLD